MSIIDGAWRLKWLTLPKDSSALWFAVGPTVRGSLRISKDLWTSPLVIMCANSQILFWRGETFLWTTVEERRSEEPPLKRDIPPGPFLRTPVEGTFIICDCWHLNVFVLFQVWCWLLLCYIVFVHCWLIVMLVLLCTYLCIDVTSSFQ